MAAASHGKEGDADDNPKDEDAAYTAVFKKLQREAKYATMTATAAAATATTTTAAVSASAAATAAAASSITTSAIMERLIRTTYSRALCLDDTQTRSQHFDSELEIRLLPTPDCKEISLAVFDLMFAAGVVSQLPESKLLDFVVDFKPGTNEPAHLLLKCRHKAAYDHCTVDRATATLKTIAKRKRGAGEESGSSSSSSSGDASTDTKKRTRPSAVRKPSSLSVSLDGRVVGNAAKKCMELSDLTADDRKWLAPVVEYMHRLLAERTPLAVSGRLSNRRDELRLSVSGYQRLNASILANLQKEADKYAAIRNATTNERTKWVPRVKLDFAMRELLIDFYRGSPAHLDLFTLPTAAS